MKPAFFIAVILSGLLPITACIFPHNHISGLWFYTHSSNPAGDNDTTLSPASFLNLQDDGTYTGDLKGFDYGRWNINGHDVYLNNYKDEITILTIEYFSKNEMRLSFKNHPSANFEKQPASFHSAYQDPFSKENNLWRLAAAKKESDAEIKNRLMNHFKFWETYFTWALDGGLETIDVRSTPTLIKIYGNGFALKPYEELPQQWKAYFFDTDDCRKANDLVKTLFEKNDIAWAHTQNKYKMFISAFGQLRQKLK